MTTAVEIAQYEQEKEMYRKMGINIEAEIHRQAWENLKPIRKALFMEQALKTETVLILETEQTNEEHMRSCSSDGLVSILCELVDSGILQEWRIKYHCADSDEDAVRIWLKQPHREE